MEVIPTNKRYSKLYIGELSCPQGACCGGVAFLLVIIYSINIISNEYTYMGKHFKIVFVDEDTHQKLKVGAVKQKVTMGEFVKKLLK